jgi:hypothetical protein
MTKRDEFRAATIRTLAGRAGHCCSECLRPTSGPAVAEDKFVNVGEAAHITAAARGPCAKLIDTDEACFTFEVLRKWKQDAEGRAFRDIATAAPGIYRRPVLVVELDDEDREFLRSLALRQERPIRRRAGADAACRPA